MNLPSESNNLLDSIGLLMTEIPKSENSENEINPTTVRVELNHRKYLLPKRCLILVKEFNL
jgi:hypothetical protein